MQSEKTEGRTSMLPEVRRAARDSTLVLLNPEAIVYFKASPSEKKMLAETIEHIGTKLLTSAGHERIASSSEFARAWRWSQDYIAISYGQ